MRSVFDFIRAIWRRRGWRTLGDIASGGRVFESVLWSFERPDEQELRRIQGFLEQVPVAGWKVPHVLRNACSRRSVTCVGNIGLIMGKLADVLAHDWAKVGTREEEWDGKSDYTVEQLPDAPGIVTVNTRLFRPGRSGSVRYGRVVVRVSKEEYAMWGND